LLTRITSPAELPLSVFRLTTPYLKYLGTKALRRWLVHALPWPALNEIGKVVDVIHRTAISTYEEKKTTGLDDPSHLDVMSVLCKLSLSLFLLLALTLFQ
jgi:hypothetical protein